MLNGWNGWNVWNVWNGWNGFVAVYLRETRLLRRRFFRHLASMMVPPLLYLVAFGTAMGSHSPLPGRSYLEFLLPGLVAMTSMTQAYGIAGEINVARFYLHVFEEFQASPIGSAAYVLGEVCAGVTRAALGVAAILAIAFVFSIGVRVDACLLLAAALNAAAFASLGVFLAMIVKSHADQALLVSFVITPMSFLGGTLFPVENLPGWAQTLVYLLPLTHAADALRRASLGLPADPANFALLAAATALFFILALSSVDHARD
ncbi:MAG: ABC transporter permease [Candidatus Accumulibacter sp.]|jgi:Nod factor-specific ABC transporter NodJ protein|nr:ABC transporter permease [Accumulibacter sp.]